MQQTCIQSIKESSDIEMQKTFQEVKGASRKSKLRTLIQLGAILNMSPILSVCDINLGDDLRKEHLDKADVLLGIIAFLSINLPRDFALRDFKNIGATLRFTHEANKKR